MIGKVCCLCAWLIYCLLFCVCVCVVVVVFFGGGSFFGTVFVRFFFILCVCVCVVVVVVVVFFSGEWQGSTIFVICFAGD